jgi:signal transduction histidine kinase/CheY-like chemotaxis protein
VELEKDSTPPRAAAHRPPPPRKADEEALADDIVRVMAAVADGDLRQRVAVPLDGQRGQRGVERTRGPLARVAAMVNDMIESLERGARDERPSAMSSQKLELVARISHELVPPLHSLLARARLLAEDPEQTLDEKQVEHARTISRSSNELLALVNEIVDLSRVDPESISVAPRDVRLSEIIDFVDRSFRPLAERKQLTYTTEIRVAGLPARIHTDPQRLQQVLGDLLASALELTRYGSITMRIYRPPPGTRFSNPALEHHGEVIAFSVLDTGIGVAEHRRSRHIARLLGGELCVERDPDRGSALTLYLPERPHAMEAPAALVSPSPSGPIADPAPAPGRKVLVIDEDVRSTFAVTSVLEAHGHSIVYADDLAGGIDAIGREPDIDVVLFDLKTSATDGYSSLRTLRAHAAFQGKPIFAVGYPSTALITTEALAQHRARCVQAGATDYLPKPIDTDGLLSIIRQC